MHAEQSQPLIKQRGRPGNPAWRKGVSGNPSGKSKTPPDIKALCQQLTDESVRTLAKCMRDERAPWSTRTTVAQFLIERGHGRAAITVDPGAAEALAAGSISLLAALQSMSSPQPVVSAPLIDVTPGDTDKPSD